MANKLIPTAPQARMPMALVDTGSPYKFSAPGIACCLSEGGYRATCYFVWVSSLKFRDFIKADGSVHPDAPERFKKRLEIRQAFPSPYRETEDELATTVGQAIGNG